jgi:hypothetical protein
MVRVLLCLLAVGASTRSANAQQCGWDGREMVDGEPLVFSTLLSRDSSNAVSMDAIAEFRKWVDVCDATAARIGTSRLRTAADRHRSNNVINALYGVMLARGPEVQVEGAAGYVFRAVVPNSNAENEATRRLAGVAERTGWPQVAGESTTSPMYVTFPVKISSG